MSDESKGLTREELNDIVPRVLAGDQDAFAILHKAYDRAVHKVVSKYAIPLRFQSLGLYMYEDVYNECWEWIIRRLPTYSTERANMMTFIYLMCKSCCCRLLYTWHMQVRSPGKGMTPLSLDMESDRDDENYTLMSVLEDPVNVLEQVSDELQLFEHLYFIQKFVNKLNSKYKQVYYHQIKGLTLQESGDIILVTRERIRQMRLAIETKRNTMYEWFKDQDNYNEAVKFGSLLLSSIPDDDLADQLDCNLATIKICRELLELAGLYDTVREVAI